MTIEELIKKLPERFQAIARRYAHLLIDMGFEELEAWIELISTGEWEQAYKNLISKMNTDELVGEQDKLNEILKALNEENAEFVSAQKDIVLQVLLTLLLMLRKQVE